MSKKALGWGIPYVTIGVGLLVLRSAWLAIFAYHAAMVCLILISRTRPTLPSLFKSNRRGPPVIASVVGAGSGGLLYILWPLLAVPEDIGPYVLGIGLTPTTWPLFIVYYAVATPLLEEYFWRGLLAGDSRNIAPGDLFFSGYHLLVLAGRMAAGWLFVIFLVLCLTAWCWRRANRSAGGLLPSLLSHAAADISVIVVIYRMTAGGGV
ncbi:MAG: CPBP family intramembrane metalloprotease [Chloroflexi bacterium]|nr:CPBP family intramembrane metalloprotease [Chloroflexota bacterium]